MLDIERSWRCLLTKTTIRQQTVRTSACLPLDGDVKEDNPPFNSSFLHIGTTSLRPSNLQAHSIAQAATNQRLEEGSTKPKEALRQIFQCLRAIRVKLIAGKLTNAVYLDLKDKRIGNNGGVAIAGVLATNTELNLSACGIGNVGMEALSQALVQNTSMKELHLSLIVFGPVGLRSLTNALKLNTGLRTMGLCNCGIGDEGAAALADALTVNTTLQALYLWDNTFGDPGATSLLNALTDFITTLTSLEFDHFPRHARTAITMPTSLVHGWFMPRQSWNLASSIAGRSSRYSSRSWPPIPH
jgi:Leucine Rich repeat